MEFRFSKMFAFLTLTTLVAMASHAAAVRQPLPQLSYWNSVLPNTPMPKAFSELVHPGDLVSKNFLRPAGAGINLTKPPMLLVLVPVWSSWRRTCTLEKQ
ncbi:hypothetical protein ACFX2A_044561 [Malus domestica]